jgi:hypothetical protein
MAKAILFGLISGILSYFFLVILGDSLFSAGVVFGIITLLFFKFNRKKESFEKSDLLWIVLSTISYFAAFFTTLLAQSLLSWIPGLFVGGFFGALLMLMSFSLIEPLPFPKILILSFLGGILATSFNFFSGVLQPNYSNNLEQANLQGLLTLYLIWQTGMMVSMYWMVKKSEKRK